METTSGHLLGGRVRYDQPRSGFRSGIEPVLLAAAVPARAGERVVEGGSGAGAGLLCLAARVSGVTGLGVERDAALVARAEANAAANGFTGLHFLAADLTADAPAGPFDHAFANPPYHVETGTRPAEPIRAAAKHADADTLTAWATALAAGLRPRGTLTFVVPAAQLPATLAAFAAARCGSLAIMPLWARQGTQAKLALIQGIAGGRGGCILAPGLVLHGEGGAYTEAAERILRGGAALAMRG